MLPKQGYDDNGSSNTSKVTAEMGAAPYEAVDDSHTTPPTSEKTREPLSLGKKPKQKWRSIRHSIAVTKALKNHHTPTNGSLVDLRHSYSPTMDEKLNKNLDTDTSALFTSTTPHPPAANSTATSAGDTNNSSSRMQEANQNT